MILLVFQICHTVLEDQMEAMWFVQLKFRKSDMYGNMLRSYELLKVQIF